MPMGPRWRGSGQDNRGEQEKTSMGFKPNMRLEKVHMQLIVPARMRLDEAPVMRPARGPATWSTPRQEHVTNKVRGKGKARMQPGLEAAAGGARSMPKNNAGVRNKSVSGCRRQLHAGGGAAVTGEAVGTAEPKSQLAALMSPPAAPCSPPLLDRCHSDQREGSAEGCGGSLSYAPSGDSVALLAEAEEQAREGPHTAAAAAFSELLPHTPIPARDRECTVQRESSPESSEWAPNVAPTSEAPPVLIAKVEEQERECLSAAAAAALSELLRVAPNPALDRERTAQQPEGSTEGSGTALSSPPTVEAVSALLFDAEEQERERLRTSATIALFELLSHALHREAAARVRGAAVASQLRAEFEPRLAALASEKVSAQREAAEARRAAEESSASFADSCREAGGAWHQVRELRGQLAQLQRELAAARMGTPQVGGAQDQYSRQQALQAYAVSQYQLRCAEDTFRADLCHALRARISELEGELGRSRCQVEVMKEWAQVNAERAQSLEGQLAAAREVPRVLLAEQRARDALCKAEAQDMAAVCWCASHPAALQWGGSDHGEAEPGATSSAGPRTGRLVRLQQHEAHARGALWRSGWLQLAAAMRRIQSGPSDGEVGPTSASSTRGSCPPPPAPPDADDWWVAPSGRRLRKGQHPDAGWALCIDNVSFGIALYSPKRWGPICWDAAASVVRVSAIWALWMRDCAIVIDPLLKLSGEKAGLPATSKAELEQFKKSWAQVRRNRKVQDDDYYRLLTTVEMCQCTFEWARLRLMEIFDDAKTINTRTRLSYYGMSAVLQGTSR